MSDTVVSVADPEMVKKIFADRNSFPDRPRMLASRHQSFPQGMVGLPSNDQWSKQRRLLSPLFAEKYMKGYCPLIKEKVDEMIRLLEAHGEKKPVDVLTIISAAAMDS